MTDVADSSKMTAAAAAICAGVCFTVQQPQHLSECLHYTGTSYM